MTRTQCKLDEAAFFFARMQRSRRAPANFSYYLSAFISAARSVPWIMRAEYGRVGAWADWYEGKQPTEEERDFLRRLNELRVQSQKRCPLVPYVSVTLTFSDLSPEQEATVLSWKHGARITVLPDAVDGLLGTVTEKWFELPEFPDTDITAVCARYLGLLKKLVAECSAKFSPSGE